MAHSGTITQTFPVVTQTAAGETDFFSAKSTISVSTSFLGSFTNAEVSAIEIQDRTLSSLDQTASSSVLVTGSAVYTAGPEAQSSLLVTARRKSVTWETSVRSRAGLLKSSANFTLTVPISSQLNASDSVVLGRTTAIIDAITIAATLTTYGVFLNQESGTVLIADRILVGQGEVAASSVIVSASLTTLALRYQAESSTVIVDDVDVSHIDYLVEASDTVTVSDSVSFEGSIFNNTETDTIIVRDSYWARDFGALAWVLNPETSGVVSYDNFGFTSMAYHNAVLYSTSNDGIFALTGDTDDGRNITAYVKTGFLDFDREETKRLSDIFLGYTGGQLEFDVETYDAPQEVYTYALEERDAEAPRNNRLKVGRGLSSRYWRFSIRNVDGAEFQVYDVTAEVATSKRRL